MSKKIVILALHLGTGGAEKVICNLANLLIENNSVKIISTYKLNEKPAFKINDSVEIEYLIQDLKPNKQELKDSLKSFNLIRIFKELLTTFKVFYLRKSLMIKAIKNLDCDIVISTRILHSNWVRKYANKNIIKIAQEHNHHNNNKKYIRKVIKSVKDFNYFIPVSKELADFYTPKLENTKVLYIPNFIDNLPDKKCNLKSTQLISVGRLDKIKGFDDLIDIFSILHKKHPDLVLHIVGDGPQKQSLQNKINQLNLQDKIHLCGFKLSKDLEKEYLNSSIYLMTSFSESFGLVLVEAASYGLPLIAYDTAQGAKEIIQNNKNGFLISNRNKNKYINAITELIENSQMQKRFSEHSLVVANNFSKDKISEIWSKFIDNIGDKNV